MPFDRIAIDPAICQGRARVSGARITVEFVLKLIGNGYTPAEIVAAYPILTETDIRQCATYGAWLASETWTNTAVRPPSPAAIL